jgi:hypothetical protein
MRPQQFLHCSALAAILILCLAGCAQQAGPTVLAQFRLRADSTDTIRVCISAPAAIAQADSLLGTQQVSIVTGVPQSGDGGYNTPWHWHLDPATVAFAEITIEACQTTVRNFEAHLPSWQQPPSRICIFSSVQAREF